jgi:hypothetical protein
VPRRIAFTVQRVPQKSAAVALNEYTDEVVRVEDAVAVFERASDFDTELVKVNSFKYWADATPLSFTSLLVVIGSDWPARFCAILTLA